MNWGFETDPEYLRAQALPQEPHGSRLPGSSCSVPV